MSADNLDQPATADFTSLVLDYARGVASNFSLQVDAQPEDQLKAPVGGLMSSVGRMTGLDVSWRTEVRSDDVQGRPDVGVTVNRLIVGHVELKRPGMGAIAERFTGPNRAQWRRFQALPNLIYTDGSEWSLYRSGQLASRVRIASDVSGDGAAAVDIESAKWLENMLVDFLHWEPVVPATARGLAEFLAPLARILRDEVRKSLGRAGSPLRSLLKEWGGLLFPETDDVQFADAYAQTLTYALLLARFEGAENLRPAYASEALERDHSLLAEALRLMEAPSVREELKMPIELLERSVAAVDALGIRHEGDPWLYFYEDFLGAYDPKLRKDRGVYFTPVEVVRLQVKLAGELLRTRFGKPLAFADDDVVVLDPAVGTGTYPLAVLDYAVGAVRDRLGPGAVPAKVQDLADRLYAFELLVGPYSVAHLRVSQRLRDAGVTDKPAKVYLTDTLESPNRLPDFAASLLQESMSRERSLAQEVKQSTRVFVCLGNPPYDREARESGDEARRRKGGWVRHGDVGADTEPAILEDFLAPVREAGRGVHLKNLYNDYVYFWRWALWKVFDSTEDAGIVTFITASSYLRGPGFEGMRRKMRQVFDELWIIDLEGDSLGARKTENVFAIRTPVAIAVGVRFGSPQPERSARVWKVRLTGSEQEKLTQLESVDAFADLGWQECSSGWASPFFPAVNGGYSALPLVTDIFPWQQSGVKAGRTWPISPERRTLERRWKELVSEKPERRANLFVNRPTGRRVTDSPPALHPETEKLSPIWELTPATATPRIVRYSYRSFDRQRVIADARLFERPGPRIWSVYGPKQIYMTSLLTATLGRGPAAVASEAIPDLDHFRGSFGGKHVIPLWRDSSATRPNVTHGLLELLGGEYGAPVAAEDLFAYAYGILAQPAYVERFWDELELPPPRLPITKDSALFRIIAAHGARLLYLHTFGKRFEGPADNGFAFHGEARCAKGVSRDRYPEGHQYDPAARALRVGDGEFSPVEPEVWNYSVSGLQVVKSWLDYRKLNRAGRKSSPLDHILPERWEFTEQLLELLWTLERTLALQPRGAQLLDQVMRSSLFTADDLPDPAKAERQPPTAVASMQNHLHASI